MAHKDDEYTSDGKKINWMPQRTHQPNYHKHYYVNGKMGEVTPMDMQCEMQLQAIGDFAPLNVCINLGKLEQELKAWDNSWVPYLRREGVTNDREGLLLVGAEGDKVGDSLSMPEVRERLGARVEESDLTYRTELYDALPSLHPILDMFETLGRTMLVKLNKGGWFPPHRDHPQLTRDTFRLVGFVSRSCGHSNFEWEHDYRRVNIEPGRVYYVDTRKTHRTACWADNSIHLVMNIPKTWENVLKVLSITEHY